MCVNNLYDIFPFYSSHLQEMYSLKKNSKTVFFETSWYVQLHDTRFIYQAKDWRLS